MNRRLFLKGFAACLTAGVVPDGLTRTMAPVGAGKTSRIADELQKLDDEWAAQEMDIIECPDRSITVIDQYVPLDDGRTRHMRFVGNRLVFDDILDQPPFVEFRGT